MRIFRLDLLPLCLLALVSLACVGGQNVHAAATPKAALEVHMEAINTLGTDAIVGTQHFPFTHLWPDGRSDQQKTAAEFEPIDPKMLGTEWHHSVLDEAKEIAATPTAVTYLIKFSRHRADNSVIASYQAIWIATKIGPDWKVQFRHGALALP